MPEVTLDISGAGPGEFMVRVVGSNIAFGTSVKELRDVITEPRRHNRDAIVRSIARWAQDNNLNTVAELRTALQANGGIIEVSIDA